MTGSWEAKLEALGGEKRIHYSLERFTQALKEAGSPQDSVKSLVVAGTNGKGTTTLLISRALQLHGYQVSTYLSPHLQKVSERFLDNLQPWPVDRLEALCQEAWPLAQKYQLSYFEFLTLLFFMGCAHNRPDFAVLEVGLGGRLDATNVTHPQATVITNIDWDHMDYLGDSLAKILQEKMGILRPGVSVTSGIEIPELQKQLREYCKPLNIPIHFGEQVTQKVKAKSWQGQVVNLGGEEFLLKNPSSGALKNAALAFLFLQKNFPEIPLSVLKEAFSSVVHPGRFEVVQEKPKIILSGDHNIAGMKTLVNTLGELKARNLYCLCGFSPDKNSAEMVKMLKPFCKELILTKVARARGVYSKEYEALATFEPVAEKAAMNLLEKVGPEDVLLVTGSLYLVGEVRSIWKKDLTFF